MDLVYLGTPEVAVPPLRALVDTGHRIHRVVTGPPRRRARRAEPSPSPVEAAARLLDLPVAYDLEHLDDCGAQLGVVVAFGRLIPAPLLSRLPMVNLHFSDLPRWRGAAPVERAILAGDTSTAVCLMSLEAGLDTGPVHDRVHLEIGDRTADSLRAEMKVPGRAWLQFEVKPDDSGSGSRVTQTAVFDPTGLAGLLYWYGIYPLHAAVFRGMLAGIARAARREGY